MSEGEEMEVEAANALKAKVGDRVVLTIDTSPLLKATFLLYILPVLFMIIGAVIGERVGLSYGYDESGISALFGFLFFFLSIFLVRSTANKMAQNKDYRPKITRILRRISSG